MMKYILVCLISLVIGACMSPPSGDKVLNEKLDASRAVLDFPETLDEGRPIYYQGYIYSFIDPAGNVWPGTDIYIYAGREKIDVMKIIENKEKGE